MHSRYAELLLLEVVRGQVPTGGELPHYPRPLNPPISDDTRHNGTDSDSNVKPNLTRHMCTVAPTAETISVPSALPTDYGRSQLPTSHHFHPSSSPVISLCLGILHEQMRTQMLAKPSLNLLQRTGGDDRGGRAQPG